jgi:PIN domain nuclease of toxin-antitoxin system
MTCLLDTHYMLWAVTDTGKISKKVQEVITNPANTVIVSAISFWEVSLKASIGKLHISGAAPQNLPAACLQMGFAVEDLSAEVCSTYHLLQPTYHKDPFDRMLIWLAIRNSYTLISVDKNVSKYTTEGLRILATK